MIDIQLTGLVKEFEVGKKILDGLTFQVDSGERVDYMLALFLNRPDYRKLEDLSDFLYVSSKTLTNESVSGWSIFWNVFP